MNKGILTLIALGLTASALTGCSALGQSQPAPAPATSEASASATPSSSATESSSPEATESASAGEAAKERLTDDEFTDFIREKTTTAYIMGNNEIVNIATDTCDAYDEGGSLRTVLGNISDKFLETTANVKMDEEAFFGDLAYIAGAGVGNYCPEHADQFKAEIDEAMAANKTS